MGGIGFPVQGRPSLNDGIFVESGSFAFGATGDSHTVTLANDVEDLSRAFVLIRSNTYTPIVETLGYTVGRREYDMSIKRTWLSTTTIRFDRPAAAANVDWNVDWVVVRCLNEEFSVEHIDLSLVSTASAKSAAIAAGTDVNVVPFLACSYLDSASFQSTTRLLATTKIVFDAGSYKVQADRGLTPNTLTLAIEIVTFSAPFSVEKIEKTFAAAGADENITVADVGDWDNAFIYSTHRTASSGSDEAFATYRAGTSTTEVIGKLNAAATIASYNGIFYVIKKTGLSCQHYTTEATGHGTTSLGTNATDSNVIAGFTAVDLDRSIILGTITNSSTLQEFQREVGMVSKFASTTSIEQIRQNFRGAMSFAGAVIDFSGA